MSNLEVICIMNMIHAVSGHLILYFGPKDTEPNSKLFPASAKFISLYLFIYETILCEIILMLRTMSGSFLISIIRQFSATVPARKPENLSPYFRKVIRLVEVKCV